MDIDAKIFFETPPRMKEDVKEYVRTLAATLVGKFVQMARIMFGDERIHSKHIKWIVLALCPDPITMYNRNGLCVQNVKMKHFSKVLCKGIDDAVEAMAQNKYGEVDKKIHRGCAKLAADIKCHASAIVALASIVSQTCGILMQSAVENYGDVKTLTLECIKEHGVMHRSSSGDVIPYSSFMRFLNMVQHFQPRSREGGKPKKVKESKTKTLLQLEVKPKVSFTSSIHEETLVNV